MRSVLRGERLVALFIFAWIAFHPPILNLFAVKATVLGWPVLYLYILAAWAAVIALVALIAGRQEESPGPERAGEHRPGPEREG
ncbi:MAG: hypothetical protein ACT4N4_17910 [Rhodospirillales bacterium]